MYMRTGVVRDGVVVFGLGFHAHEPTLLAYDGAGEADENDTPASPSPEQDDGDGTDEVDLTPLLDDDVSSGDKRQSDR